MDLPDQQPINQPKARKPMAKGMIVGICITLFAGGIIIGQFIGLV